MSPVEAVLFDLDDTLLTYNQDLAAVALEAFERAGVERFCDPAALRTAAGDVGHVEDDHEFLVRTFRLAAERHGGPVERAADLARAYEAETDHADVSFRPGAERALAAARVHGPVGLVTNSSPRTAPVKLDALGLTDAFGTVVYAGTDTAPKPDPEPFERALADLGVGAPESLYVGNSLEMDVAGARRAGLRAAWYPRERDAGDPGDHHPDYTFETLDDLERVL